LPSPSPPTCDAIIIDEDETETTDDDEASLTIPIETGCELQLSVPMYCPTTMTLPSVGPAIQDAVQDVVPWLELLVEA